MDFAKHQKIAAGGLVIILLGLYLPLYESASAGSGNFWAFPSSWILPVIALMCGIAYFAYKQNRTYFLYASIALSLVFIIEAWSIYAKLSAVGDYISANGSLAEQLYATELSQFRMGVGWALLVGGLIAFFVAYQNWGTVSDKDPQHEELED